MDPTDLDAAPPLAPNPPRHVLAVTGVVRDAAGRVLLVRSKRGWEPPGGHVEPGEDLVAALLREIAEETGCRALVERVQGVYSVCDRPYLLLVVFACSYLDGDIRGSAETPEVAWFASAVAPRLISPPPAHAPATELFASNGATSYRAYKNDDQICFHDALSLAAPPLQGLLTGKLRQEEGAIIIATSACIRDDQGRVLLVRSGWRGWEFPGGQVEQGEDLITSLQREVREESGVAVDLGRLAGIYCNVGVPYVTQFMFRATYAGGDLQPSYETPEVSWFKPDAALALPMRSAMHARLEDGLSNEPGVAYRVYRTNPRYEGISARRLS